MKTLLFFLLALTCAPMTQASSYTYTTDSGLAAWNAGATDPSKTNEYKGVGTTGGGNYTSFTLNISAVSYNADHPDGTTGSLTTATNSDGSPLVGDQLTEAQEYFTASEGVQLTEISVMGRYNNATGNNLQNTYLQVLDSSGSVLTTSTVAVQSNMGWFDPWADSSFSLKYSSFASATYTFDTSLLLSLDDTYTFRFVNADGNSQSVGLWVTSTSNLGNVNGTTTWSPIMTATTQSIVPEPSSMTLALTCLTGLLLRRRRKQG